jgi:hypothetical protein
VLLGLLLLTVSTPIVDAVHTASFALMATESSDYGAALVALDDANRKVNSDPETHMAALADAIAALRGFSRELADDEDGSQLLELATLNLARALLRVEDRAGAVEVMDDLLRRGAGTELPVQRFGPTLVEFYEARLDVLTRAGTAEIQFECALSCRVLLERRAVKTRSGPLYLGAYDVLIESSDGTLAPERQVVTLDEPGAVVVLRYPLAGLEPIIDEDEPASTPRLAPRWAEVLISVVGAGAVGAGAALLAIDGRCPGGGDPINDAGELCPTLYETTAGGAVAMGLGGLALGGGLVLLTVDEIQTAPGRKDHQAMLSWSVRF